MHPHARKMRDKIESDQPVLGTFLCEFNGSGVVHAFAKAGLDFTMIDCEHGNHSPEAVVAMIEACWGAGICALVRPPTTSRAMITSLLDAGAGGALFPSIETMDQVREAVRVTKYRPVGKRGVHLMRGHTRHQRLDTATFMAEANRDLLTIIQIEMAAAVEIVDEIAATPGVDALYVGPGDLSVDLGVPGQWSSPQLQSAIKKVIAACRKHGKIMGCHANDVAHMPALRDLGVRMFGYNCDIGLFVNAITAIADDFRTRVAAPAATPRKQAVTQP